MADSIDDFQLGRIVLTSVTIEGSHSNYSRHDVEKSSKRLIESLHRLMSASKLASSAFVLLMDLLARLF